LSREDSASSSSISPTIERKRRHDQIADRLGEIGHAIHRLDRIGDLHEGDRVGQDHRIVAGDDLLLLHVEDDVLGHQLVGDAVEVGDEDVEPGAQRGVVLAQALDHPFLALRHQTHPLGDRDHHEHQHRDRDRESFGHDHFLAFLVAQAFVTLT
jgi:hypothetical protein